MMRLKIVLIHIASETGRMTRDGVLSTHRERSILRGHQQSRHDQHRHVRVSLRRETVCAQHDGRTWQSRS